MSNDYKNSKILTIVIIITLFISVIGATFSYFTNQYSGPRTIEEQVSTTTGDSSSFMVNGLLNIDANLSNFQIDMGDESSQTAIGRVVFKAGANNTNGADLCYTVSVDIQNNNFDYSKDENTPELILQAKYADVVPYTGANYPNMNIDDTTLNEYQEDIGNIKYVTVAATDTDYETGYLGRTSAISGYDVTMLDSKIYIPYSSSQNSFRIHADSGTTVEQDWIFKINFINYNYDQSDISNPHNNNEKNFNGSIRFDKTPCVVRLKSIRLAKTANSITVTPETDYESDDVIYSYSIDGGVTWKNSSDESYTFEELESGKNYSVLAKATYLGIESEEIEEEITTDTSEIPINITRSGTQVGNVTVTNNDVSEIANTGKNVMSNTPVTLSFSSNGAYFVQSVTGCTPDTTNKNTDNVSIASITFANYTKEQTCTVNYAYRYSYRQGTKTYVPGSTSCTKSTASIVRCCSKNDTICTAATNGRTNANCSGTVNAYSDSSCSSSSIYNGSCTSCAYKSGGTWKTIDVYKKTTTSGGYSTTYSNNYYYSFSANAYTPSCSNATSGTCYS